MQRQKKKQEKLILKMLPKEVVAKLNEGLNTAEEFESATLFFSSVVDFVHWYPMVTEMVAELVMMKSEPMREECDGFIRSDNGPVK